MPRGVRGSGIAAFGSGTPTNMLAQAQLLICRNIIDGLIGNREVPQQRAVTSARRSQVRRFTPTAGKKLNWRQKKKAAAALA
jgi:hypothetical protein